MHHSKCAWVAGCCHPCAIRHKDYGREIVPQKHQKKHSSLRACKGMCGLCTLVLYTQDYVLHSACLTVMGAQALGESPSPPSASEHKAAAKLASELFKSSSQLKQGDEGISAIRIWAFGTIEKKSTVIVLSTKFKCLGSKKYLSSCTKCKMKTSSLSGYLTLLFILVKCTLDFKNNPCGLHPARLS